MDRKLKIEQLETRRLLFADVNMDNVVSAQDALIVINHISRYNDTPAQYSNLDVNGDGSITALDALNVINHMQKDISRTITFSLGNINTHGLDTSEVLWAIHEAFYEYEKISSLDFKITSGSNANYSISSGELYLGNGFHARGWVYGGLGGRIIQFHNGTVSPYKHNGQSLPINQGFKWQAFKNPQLLKQVMMHEIGHALYKFGHSSNTSCVMHSNASTDDFCSHEESVIRRIK